MTFLEDFILKGALGLMLSIVAIIDYFRQTNEKNDKIEQYINALLICLPLYLLIGFLFGLFHGFEWDFYSIMIPTLVKIGIVWIVYDGILILALPRLRKKFTSFTCAYLWILPNFLYLIFNIYFGSGTDILSPWVTIYIPKSIVTILLIVWFFGFAIIAWKMIRNHRSFVNNLMENAVLVTDSDLLISFNKVKYSFDKVNQIQLYRSPATKTPVSIGMNLAKMKVVLPMREYSQEELQWIFRHEITHLRKNDCALKFFLAMTNAIFWFIPFTWIASKRLTEDQELSCDEMVLAGCDREQRKHYASLLLNTAGDSTGFSTCLSSTGESMRYRLKHAVNPEYHGGIHNPLIILVSVMIMIVFVFSIDITTTAGKAEDIIFQKGSKYELDHIESIVLRYKDDWDNEYILDYDEKEWLSYLNQARVKRVRNRYPEEADYTVIITYKNHDPNADKNSEDCIISLENEVLDFWNLDVEGNYEYILSDCGYKNLVEKAKVRKKVAIME